MSDDPCQKERDERDKAYEEWVTAFYRSKLGASHRSTMETRYVSFETTEDMRKAGEMEPELKKIYREKCEAFNKCIKIHK